MKALRRHAFKASKTLKVVKYKCAECIKYEIIQIHTISFQISRVYIISSAFSFVPNISEVVMAGIQSILQLTA